MTFSSKCFLCKPSGAVRFSKSGGLILVNTTFILFSWGVVGLLVHSPIFNGEFGAMKASNVLFMQKFSL